MQLMVHLEGWNKVPRVRMPHSCVAKTCAERPVFARMVGELWEADPSKCPRTREANASSGSQSETPRRSWKLGLALYSEDCLPDKTPLEKSLNLRLPTKKGLFFVHIWRCWAIQKMLSKMCSVDKICFAKDTLANILSRQIRDPEIGV